MVSETRDPDTGAIYYSLIDATVAKTIEVSELMSVDLDQYGNPVGIEYAGSAEPTELDWKALEERFEVMRGVRLAQATAAVLSLKSGLSRVSFKHTSVGSNNIWHTAATLKSSGKRLSFH